jgi:hypothetical protein
MNLTDGQKLLAIIDAANLAGEQWEVAQSQSERLYAMHKLLSGIMTQVGDHERISSSGVKLISEMLVGLVALHLGQNAAQFSKGKPNSIAGSVTPQQWFARANVRVAYDLLIEAKFGQRAALAKLHNFAKQRGIEVPQSLRQILADFTSKGRQTKRNAAREISLKFYESIRQVADKMRDEFREELQTDRDFAEFYVQDFLNQMIPPGTRLI